MACRTWQRITQEARYLGERIRDVRQGPDGHPYLLTDSGDGRVLWVLAALRLPDYVGTPAETWLDERMIRHATGAGIKAEVWVPAGLDPPNVLYSGGR